MVAAGRRTRGGIVLKSRREIDLMRQAGRIVSGVLDRVCALAAPGVTTGDLNEAAERMIAEAGAEALFKGVRNPSARIAFPAALCVSVNEEVVHGIPGKRALRDGDLVSIDCGVRCAGYCGDSARTVAVGRTSPEAQRLLEVTRQALDLAIAETRTGRLWSEVAGLIQSLVESAGMSVVREFTGHGIGREMHEEPKVPNYWDRSNWRVDFKVEAGMTLAIEPMVTLGGPEVRYADADAWVIVTRDGCNAAHFEHTIAVTSEGAEVLTDGR